VTPAYWSFNALAATNDLNDIEKICGQAAAAPAQAQAPAQAPPPVAPPTCGDHWDHAESNLIGNLAMLALLTLVYAGLALAALRRHEIFGRRE
jgi:hypothetical protein